MKNKSKNNSFSIPLLPLRDIVVFPGMITPLFVGRDKSIKALESVMDINKKIFLVTQKNPQDDSPSTDEIYDTGVIGKIVQLLKLPDGTLKVLIEAIEKAKIVKYIKSDNYFVVEVKLLKASKIKKTKQVNALTRRILSRFEDYSRLNHSLPSDSTVALNQSKDLEQIANTISSYLVLKIDDKQKLLCTTGLEKLLNKILIHLENEIGVLEVEKKIKSRVKRQMEKTQREYYLNEQLKAVQKELGDLENSSDEYSELEKKNKYFKTN